MPEPDRIARRSRGGEETLARVIGARGARVDEDHVDRLVQMLALVGLAEPVRNRAVRADHPFTDRREAGRGRDLGVRGRGWRLLGVRHNAARRERHEKRRDHPGPVRRDPERHVRIMRREPEGRNRETGGRRRSMSSAGYRAISDPRTLAAVVLDPTPLHGPIREWRIAPGWLTPNTSVTTSRKPRSRVMRRGGGRANHEADMVSGAWGPG
jgi:hypothetical protein